MMGEAVPHETQFALFDVLFDWIVILVFGNFLFGIGPTRNFDNHVEDLGAVCRGGGKQGNVMPGRNHHAVFFKVDAMIEGIGRAWRLVMDTH